jgi:hypothetical protein
MLPNDQATSEGSAVREQRRTHSLYYYEQIGSRFYLRITRLGLALILLFTIVPVIAILSLFLLNQATPMPDVDVMIKPRPADNTSTYPAIKQPSQAPTPRAVRQPPLKPPSPPVLSSPPANSNTQ